MTVPNTPIVNGGLFYVNGLQVSAGALDAGTGLFAITLVITGGIARDSSNINDISLPNATYTLSIGATSIGKVNGLDTGAGLAVSALYAVYAIGDSTGYQPSGTLLSLSFTQPQLPEGYDMFRRIGTVQSNAAQTGILNFVQRGNGSQRDTWYGVSQAGVNAAGADTAFHPITLTASVPVSGQEVYIDAALTADAGGTRTVVFAADARTTIAQGATGMAILSSAATVVTSGTLKIPVNTAAGVQTIQYALSNAGVTNITVTITGFVDYL